MPHLRLPACPNSSHIQPPLRCGKVSTVIGGDVNAGSRGCYPPLHTAAKTGNFEAAELLISNGADVHLGNNNGDTALHFAALDGYSELVSFFIEKKADVNAVNR